MRARFPFLAILIVLAGACGGEAPESDRDDAGKSTGGAAVSNVPLTGTIIEIGMTTDDKGNYFTPATVEAKPGDVLRFKLVMGVHNVNFLADSNPGKTGLPAMSPFLQLPGQTHDVPLTFGTGHFFYQCDPHALLGMVGRIEVEND